MNNETEVNVFIMVDEEGNWSAFGASDECPETRDEILAALSRWNLRENLNHVQRVYRAHIAVPAHQGSEVLELISRNKVFLENHGWTFDDHKTTDLDLVWSKE